MYTQPKLGTRSINSEYQANTQTNRGDSNTFVVFYPLKNLSTYNKVGMQSLIFHKILNKHYFATES